MHAVDMWALGEVMHQLLTKRPVFADLATLHRYTLGLETFPVNQLQRQRMSSAAISLIEQVMMATPSLRLTAEQALQTAWLADVRPQSSPPPSPSLELVSSVVGIHMS
jgi:serine/threonine protein kinase